MVHAAVAVEEGVHGLGEEHLVGQVLRHLGHLARLLGVELSAHGAQEFLSPLVGALATVGDDLGQHGLGEELLAERDGRLLGALRLADAALTLGEERIVEAAGEALLEELHLAFEGRHGAQALMGDLLGRPAAAGAGLLRHHLVTPHEDRFAFGDVRRHGDETRDEAAREALHAQVREDEVDGALVFSDEKTDAPFGMLVEEVAASGH